MNHLNTEKLISLVSKYPELYDGRHKDHADLNKRESIWQRIAKEMGVKVEVCKAKWNILRGGYRRALRNKESGYSFVGKKWRFEDDLSFLKDCVLERRRHSRRGATDNVLSDNDEEFTMVKEEPTDMIYETLSDTVPDEEWASSCGSVPANETEVLKLATPLSTTPSSERKEPNAAEVDSVRQFFLSLAETVKSLPLIVQAQVKAEVFKSVNTAELNYLQEKNRCVCENKRN